MSDDVDTSALPSKGLSSVGRVLLVLSGKGGVGKSTVSVQLARALAHSGLRVGILDADLCGPSVPVLLGIRGKSVLTTPAGWIPVYAEPPQTLPVVSVGLLASDQDAPVIWRGPKKNAVVRSLLNDVCWGDLDVLVVDTPPGTSDEHLAVLEHLANAKTEGAVLVTTPQHVAVLDVTKELTFCRKLEIPVLGVVENMSGYVCPHCSTQTNVFSSDGGVKLAAAAQIPFIGKIPIDPQLCAAEETGVDPYTLPTGPQTLQALTAFAEGLKKKIKE